MARTSLTHPLLIAELAVGTKGGAVGVTFAPGKIQQEALTGAWARDLDIDLEAICAWGARYLISLLEPREFEELRIGELPKRAGACGLLWHGLPITDGAVPDHRFLEPWAKLGPALSHALLGGERVVVHCKGGLGRAGTVACLLLLDTGAAASAEEAMRLVRTARPNAIENPAQEEFIRTWTTRERCRLE